MKKIFITLVVLAILAAGYWLLAPNLVNKKVNEDFPQAAVSKTQPAPSTSGSRDSVEESVQPEVVARGKITGQGDHRAEGTASLIKSGGQYFIRLEDDFNSQNGPDLFVHLGRDGKYDKDINLGSLKGNSGSQNYQISESVNVGNYSEVWIWCRAFAVPFAMAILETVQ